MASTSDFRVGMVIRFNGALHRIEEYIHRTPGNKRGFVQAKLRNIETGRITENRFASGENVDDVRLEQKDYQYLYKDGDDFQVMDTESYEQRHIGEGVLGEGAKFMKEGEMIKLLVVGEEIVGAELPFKVELRVTETVPGVKGDTASNALKPATVETGATVHVPLFINEGDTVRVDTRSGDYLERVNA